MPSPRSARRTTREPERGHHGRSGWADGRRHRRRERDRPRDRARARRCGDERRDRRHRGGRGTCGGVGGRSRGARAIPVHADVSDYASMQALADAAYAEFGAVHVLCNNAGVLIFGDMQNLKIEDWNWLLGVNVFGVLNGIYAFLPRMLEARRAGPHREHRVDRGAVGPGRVRRLEVGDPEHHRDAARGPRRHAHRRVVPVPGHAQHEDRRRATQPSGEHGPEGPRAVRLRAGVVRRRPVALRPPRARGDPRRTSSTCSPASRRARRTASREARSPVQALVDVIDAGVVDEEPIATGSLGRGLHERGGAPTAS